MEYDDERLCHDGPREEAIQLYYQMKVASTQPNNITFPIVLKVCAELSALKKGMEIHGCSMECDDERLCHDGPREEAIQLYYQMKVASTQPNNITFPIVLKVCATLSALKKGMEIHGCYQKGF
jgi:flagellin-specific chaperone FliS